MMAGHRAQLLGWVGVKVSYTEILGEGAVHAGNYGTHRSALL